MKLKKGAIVKAVKGLFTGIRIVETTRDKNNYDYPIRVNSLGDNSCEVFSKDELIVIGYLVKK